MKVSTIMRKPLQLCALTLAGLAVLVVPAEATHWAQSGSDPGRSSFQVSDEAFLPATFRGRGIPTAPATSAVVTGGPTFADQRMAVGSYGNLLSGCGDSFPATDALFYIFNFQAGTQMTCTDLDQETASEDVPGGSDTDAWGPEGGITPVVASTHSTSGSIYAIYNDDNGGSPNQNPGQSDISMAQFRADTGALVIDRPINGGQLLVSDFDGATITSSPVITGDLGDGSRQVFFLATILGEKHVVKLTIPNAAGITSNAPTHEIGPAVADLNMSASPTLVRMLDPDTGLLVTMVAVATTDGIKTFRASNLADPGPSASGLGLTWTPAAPVRADGSMPTAMTQVLYAASASGDSGTVVRRFMQDISNPRDPDRERLKNLIPYTTDGQASSTSTSPTLSGLPSKQMALAQQVPTTGPDLRPQPGKVIVSTSTNVFVLDTQDLSGNPARVFDADRETGFKKTWPSTSGGLGFIVDDKGIQLVFRLTPNEEGTLRVPSIPDPEDPDEPYFSPDENSLDSGSAVGQPAISGGRFVMSANNGLFIYGPSTVISSPSAFGSVRGNAVNLSATVADTKFTSVEFFVDGQSVGVDATADNDRHFSVVWNSLTKLDGPHEVYAIATNDVDQDRSATRKFVVVNFANPTAALTVGPNPANPGQPVTLDATGSLPTPTEVDEIISEWAFELDGDADFDDLIERASEGGDGKITHAFEPGTRNVGVRVTDSHGDQDQEVVKLRINAPPAANLTVSPNPAVEGQEVTVDASASTDSDGSIARYEFDLDGNGTFEHDGGSNPKVQRVIAPGTTKISARVTDNEGAASIVDASLAVNAKPVNQVPVATFKVSPNPANRDQRVLFDATGAVDPDGFIAKYEWDLDDNGTFETNSQNNPRVQRSYSTAKVYNVKLRVTDNVGAVSTVFTGTLTIKGAIAKRKSPRRLTAKVTPMRDVAVPFDFRTTGRLVRPSGVSKRAGCTGRVTVVVKAGKKTISRRTTKLRKNCTYRTSVRFRDRSRIGQGNALRFTARFQGNKALRARQATTVRVRLR